MDLGIIPVAVSNFTQQKNGFKNLNNTDSLTQGKRTATFYVVSKTNRHTVQTWNPKLQKLQEGGQRPT